MRLTWKDGVATLLVIGVVLVALAVVQGWDWPLVGSYRAGTVAILAMGLGVCALGGSMLEREGAGGPYRATMSILGFAALAFGVWALIADAEEPFIALTVVTVLMWLVATLHHLVAASAGRHGALGT
jgi:hypothetical protein